MNTKFESNQSNNGIKKKIVNYIKIHPGASFKTIQVIFDINDSTLRYYLRDLEKKDKIKSDSNKRIYYPVGRKDEQNLSEIQRKLINNVKNHPGITQKELVDKTKINRITVRSNVSELVEKQLLSLNKNGKEIHHFYIYPDELKKQETLKIITKFLLDKIDEETYWELREKIIKEN
ncbi:winged helix-turn-helix transcriptional regulator [[Eubacterium] cellulosolvens]